MTYSISSIFPNLKVYHLQAIFWNSFFFFVGINSNTLTFFAVIQYEISGYCFTVLTQI